MSPCIKKADTNVTVLGTAITALEDSGLNPENKCQYLTTDCKISFTHHTMCCVSNVHVSYCGLFKIPHF
jgi:hypothetical protein